MAKSICVKQFFAALLVVVLLGTPILSARAAVLPAVVDTAKTYVGGNLGTVTSAVLRCKAVQGAIMDGLHAIGSFFGGIFGSVDDDTNLVSSENASKLAQDAREQAAKAQVDSSGFQTMMTVPVNDGSVRDVLKKIGEQDRLFSEDVKKNTGRTAAAASATANKQTCWQVIERAAAQIILKEITKQTIDWINHGMNGKPYYVQDPHGALQDIADETIGSFTTNISTNKKDFPFGEIVAKELVAYTQNYFETSAKYSLNQVINQRYPGRSDIDFQTDFALGGFDVLLAQGLPNNNPFGFSLEARSELQYRLKDTSYSAGLDLRDQMQRGRGFLDQRVCLDPNGETDMTKCRRAQVMTPGSTIATSLDKALGSPTDQLTYGADITSDIAAIIDALLNHYLKKGLASI